VLKDFWLRYVTSTGHWCDADGCLTTPTWNHLWFIAYLLPYSLLLAAMIALPTVRRALQAAGDRVFRGWGLVVWPVLYLILIRWLLAPRFEITHALTDDWYNHALSFGAFLFGYLIARSEEARQTLMRLRWPALIVALCCWAAWATYAWTYRGDVNPSEPLRQAMRIAYALDQAGFIAAILGFGARWLNRDAPALRYLSAGVFPFYIVHQTVTVVAAYNLATLHLPLGVEAGLLILITALGCLLAYEVARRIGWLGLLLGVKPQKAGRTARSPA
jgi:glucans biosynthesis protein C